MTRMMRMVVLRRVKRLLGWWSSTSNHWSQIDTTAVVTAATTLEMHTVDCYFNLGL